MAKIYEKYRFFELQWHITAKCELKCKHCYIYNDETYMSEIINELSLKECEGVMDDLVEMCKTLKVKPRIAFTGGDPLLRNDFFDLLSLALERNIEIAILGNSYGLNENTVKKIKHYNPMYCQLSLDGLEKKHDSIRKEGCFNDIVRAIKLLKENEIPVNICMTLSRYNMGDIIPLMDYVNELKVDTFTFARFSPTGEGEKNKEWLISPNDYRNLLVDIDSKITELKESNAFTKYGKKCYLFSALLNYESGDIKLPPKDGKIYFGCSIGIHGMIILADGKVNACRRFPSEIGDIKKSKLLDIFLNSPKLNEYRGVDKLEKCSKCELMQICRGCPAIAYSTYGRWNAPDPQCWKKCK